AHRACPFLWMAQEIAAQRMTLAIMKRRAGGMPSTRIGVAAASTAFWRWVRELHFLASPRWRDGCRTRMDLSSCPPLGVSRRREAYSGARRRRLTVRTGRDWRNRRRERPEGDIVRA